MSDHDPDWWVPRTGKPTDEQLAAIGRAITQWAILDIQVQALLCELVQSPPPLGQALSEDLSIDNRLAAIKRLVATWKSVNLTKDRYEDQIEALDEALKVVAWITKNKGHRSELAHWWWIRSNDTDLFGWKYTTRPEQSRTVQKGQPAAGSITITVEGLIAFANQTSRIAERCRKVATFLESLPTWQRKYPSPNQPPSSLPPDTQ